MRGATSTAGYGDGADGLPQTEKRLLWLLVGFAAMATVGYGTFGRHPQWLAPFPWAMGFYGISQAFFGQLQIILSLGVLAWTLTTRVGGRWLPALAAGTLVGLGAELLGTGTGFPFGGYEYTSLLGISVLDQVPVLIPPSWFMMAAPIFIWVSPIEPMWQRVTLAAALMVAWDLALDPAMSYLTRYWVWFEPGAYYGMPAVNLVGWFVTAGGVMLALELVGARRWAEQIPRRWAVAFFGANLLMPLGMLAVAGAWLAVGVCLLAVGLLWKLGSGAARVGTDPETRLTRRPPTPQMAGEANP